MEKLVDENIKVRKATKDRFLSQCLPWQTFGSFSL